MDPNCYARYSKHQPANGFRLIADNFERISSIPVGGRVLDIGCGTGDVTKLFTLFTNFGTIKGMDVNPEMIEAAKSRHCDSRLSFQIGDIMSAEQYPREKFDLVTANAVMQWLPDQDLALRNIGNHLKEGGIFLAYIYCGSPMDDVFEDIIVHSKWAARMKQTYKKTFGGILKQPWMMINEPENFYSSLLRKADFEVLRCECKITTDYLTEKELHDGLALGFFGKSIDQLKDEERSEFANYMTKMFKSKLKMAGDGKFWEIKGRRIFVTAKKLGKQEERFLFLHD